MKTAFLFVLLGVAGSVSVARAEDKNLKSEELPLPRLITGADGRKFLDETPKNGVIADAKTWAKLWKTWGGDPEAPKVDFGKELVLVAAGPGPNIIRVGSLKLSDNGDLKFEWSITERAGPGITVKLLKVSREGVKTVGGNELPKGN